MDLGQQRRGVDMGPSAVRYAGLTKALAGLGYDVDDRGNLHVPVAETLVHDPADGNAHNASAIGRVCRDLYQAMQAGLAQHERMITLGGDHSVSLGSISAVLDYHVGQGDVGVLWVDAHGDFNTPETSPSGNVHGMVVAALMGRCPPALTIGECRLRPEQIVYLGVRDLDERERQALRESGIFVLTMSELDKHGLGACVRMALDQLRDATHLHVSFDLDSLDPSIAPGVGTAVPGGLSYREAHLLMETLAEDGRVRSLDIVEVNPILDIANKTGGIAVEMTASLFGKRIL
ncbi:MAG: arginase [Anaerolineae bacterium]|nr:arginase [Anaerolineae bacterium]